jgi:hypothetical protein
MAISPNRLIYFGFAAIGTGYVWKLLRGDDHEPAAALPPVRTDGLGYAGAGRNDKPMVVQDGVRSIKFYPAGDIKQRVGYIIEQMKRDSVDPKVISEATALLSKKCPIDPRSGVAGLKWCLAEKDWKAEKIALFFHALTDPNSKLAMRYTRDHATVDMFRSASLMRRIPAGDCDDMCIRLGALLMSVGYSVKCRVVAPAGAPGQWAHIYLVVGEEPGNNNPGKWYALDPTEPQHGPFWEVPKHLISTVRDFDVA